MGNPHEWQTIYTLGDTVVYNELKYLEVRSGANYWSAHTIGGL